MALSERRPSSAPNTLSRGREQIAPKYTLPRYFFAGIIWITSAAIAGLTINEMRQSPPVHRTIDKVWDISLETSEDIINRVKSIISTSGNPANKETK